MKQFLLNFLCITFLSVSAMAAQTDSLAAVKPTKMEPKVSLSQQKDIVDIFHHFFPNTHTSTRDTLALEKGKKFFWLIPVIGYAPQTNFLAQIYGNIAFKNSKANVSTIVSALAYTLNKQLLFTSMPNIWTKNNQFNFVGDYRLMQYPQDTYGLGIHSSTANEIQMNYAYLRIYQYMLKNIGHNFYAGVGYNLDYHWNIQSTFNNETIDKISRYTYGIQGTSVSSGISANFLYDNRANSINPVKGFYANVIFRGNFKSLGSDNDYQSLLMDVRKYIHFPNHSDNVLAFWSYDVLTFNGNAPFLDLPSTGWDTYSNVGRGYIQGRFRGKNLLYTEAEYRFGITKNKLLGGVVFVNAQTVPLNIDHITKVMPATGLGLRLRMNKLSRTNLSIDYGFGSDGSGGLFFNMGEVF